MERYLRNQSTISSKQQEHLNKSSAIIIGCGGLGGNIAMALARIGIGHLTLIDYDIFDVSNLNRQIFADENDLGLPKACITKTKLEVINSSIEITAKQVKVDDFNVDQLINNHDIVFDALDNVDIRLLLESACNKADIPLIHGAISGNYGHFGTSYRNNLISKIYANSNKSDNSIGNLAYMASFIASCQVKLGLDFILYNLYKDGFYCVDLNTYEIEYIAL